MTTVTAPSPESLSPPAPTTPSVSNPSPVTTTTATPSPESDDHDSTLDEEPGLSTPSTTTTTSTPTPPGLTTSPQKSNGVKSPSGKSLSPPSAGKSSQKGSSSSSSSSSSQDNSGIFVGVAVAGIVILAMIIVCIVCSSRKKRRPFYDPQSGGSFQGGEKRMRNNGAGGGGGDHVVKLPPPHSATTGSNEFMSSSGFSGGGGGYNLVSPMSPNMGGLGGLNTSSFSYEELEVATGGFSQSNMIGQGGFGYVYKGVLQNGKEVAVKSLKSGSGQGEREFQAEVEIISRVHHRYLVSLVGYCITNGQRMLVYDFVPNGTLEHHLHGKDQPTMQWAVRMRIALGSAKGLAYLHEDCHPRIIHRDIKAANILLDFNFEAMVADFGLAKLTTDNHTHVSTRVMGTFGYLAPEYASSGKLSDKSDVFSFGVMLLELITGRRPVDLTSRMEDSLVDWARPLFGKALEDGNYGELVDPRLGDNFDRNEMARIAACASASTRHSARRRPKMSQVVRALEGSSSLDDLIEVPKNQISGQQMPSSASSGALSEMNSSMYDTGAYNADMMKFRKMILTPDQETKDYSSD